MQVEPVGSEIRSIAPRIDAVNMEPGAALEEYAMMVLKVRALYKLIFDNRLVSSFLRGTPGMEAWSMLGKAQFHAFEERADGTPRYDVVIVDAPATGHGLELLRVPKVILDVVPPGLLRREAERAWGLFTDPERAGVLLVTLPEELPVSETVELYQTLRTELRLPVCGLVVNMLLPRLFDVADETALVQLASTLDPSSPLAAMATASRARQAREHVQADCLVRLAHEVPVAMHRLPTLFAQDFRRAEVERLARFLDPT
jgi:anion-transporting  ArsA/GET3 family ATPase